MYLALIKKELREVLPIAVVAALAFALVIAGVQGSSIVQGTYFGPSGAKAVPFASHDFVTKASLVFLCFATALGFQQTLWEEYRGTYLLLMHRRPGRTKIILAKLGTGLVIYLVVSCLAIVYLAVWAMTPGNQPAPFLWRLTWPSWLALLESTLFYFGAFFSGLRPGRWYGSRLLPYLAAWMLVPIGIHSKLLGLVVLMAIVATFLIAILWTANEREFS